MVAVGGRYIDIYTPTAAYTDVFLAVRGAHQGDNAAIALTAAEEFVGASLPHEVVAEAFANVASPGRLEVVRRAPLVVLDGAHNVAGAEALRRSLDEEFGAVEARTLVVGFLREKDPVEMLAALGVDAIGGPGRLLPGAEPAGSRPRGGGQGRARPRRAARSRGGRRPGRRRR